MKTLENCFSLRFCLGFPWCATTDQVGIVVNCWNPKSPKIPDLEDFDGNPGILAPRGAPQGRYITPASPGDILDGCGWPEASSSKKFPPKKIIGRKVFRSEKNFKK